VVHFDFVPTRHPRIQVTVDAELARALRDGAPHLNPGLSRSKQVHELAVVGARHLAASQPVTRDRKALLTDLADRFGSYPDRDLDWDLLRDGKRRAWPTG